MRKYKRILVVLVAAVMMLVGCGSSSQQGEEEQETQESLQEATLEGSYWFTQTQTLDTMSREAGFIGWMEGVALTEDYVFYLYRTTNDFDRELLLYRVPLQEIFTDNLLNGYYPAIRAIEATEELALPGGIEIAFGVPATECFLRFFADEQGQLYFITTTFSDNIEERKQYLYICDDAGNALEKIEVTESLQELVPKQLYSSANSLDTHDSAVDGEGYIYLASREMDVLWILEKDGTQLHKLSLPEAELQRITNIGDGKAYMVTGEGADSQIWQVYPQTGDIELILDMTATKGNGYLLQGGMDGLLYGDQKSLYECNIEKGTWQEVLTWEDHNISGKNILQARQNADGRYYALEDDRSLTLLEQVDGGVLPAQKKQVTLGFKGSPGNYLEGAIVEFNKRNAYYEVVLKEYTYEEGQQMLETELATGKAPDLFSMDMVYVEKLVKKGLIADLAPYLEDGTGMEREDLVEAVLRCNTIDGVLTCVPDKFSLDILHGKKSLVGDRMNWTVEEYLKCLTENPGIQAAEGITYSEQEWINQYNLIHTVLLQGIDYFVDTKKGEAHFDKEEFKELLQFAKNYKVENYDYEGYNETGRKVYEEKILLNNSGFASLESYMLANAALQQEGQFIGYPTYDGSISYGIRNGEAFGINAESSVKDGAWAFIEFMLTYRAEDIFYANSQTFSTREAKLNYELQKGTYKEYKKDSMYNILLDEKGEPVEAVKWKDYNSYGHVITEAYAASEEDLKNIRALIDGAVYVSDNYSNTILQIVEEEVAACLSGERSVEETINIIQNRVQLYLDEQN